MWPFKKRDKSKELLRQTLTRLPQAALGRCPKPECICYTCPCRGKCSAEKEFRNSGACFVDNGPRIAECSWNKHLKGELGDAKEETKRGKPGSVIPIDKLDSDEIPTVWG